MIVHLKKCLLSRRGAIGSTEQKQLPNQSPELKSRGIIKQHFELTLRARGLWVCVWMVKRAILANNHEETQSDDKGTQNNHRQTQKGHKGNQNIYKQIQNYEETCNKYKENKHDHKEN